MSVISVLSGHFSAHSKPNLGERTWSFQSTEVPLPWRRSSILVVASLLMCNSLFSVSPPSSGVTLHGWPLFVVADTGSVYRQWSTSAFLIDCVICLVLASCLVPRSRPGRCRGPSGWGQGSLAVSMAIAAIGVSLIALFEATSRGTPSCITWVTTRPVFAQVVASVVIYLALTISFLRTMAICRCIVGRSARSDASSVRLLPLRLGALVSATSQLCHWRGWRIQFGLRACFALLACSGIVFSEARSWVADASAAAVLSSAGCTCEYADQLEAARYLADLVPDWLRDILRSRYCGTVVGVNVNLKEMGDTRRQADVMARLRQLSHLQMLTIYGGRLSGSDMSQLANCRSLRGVMLKRVTFPEKSFSVIGRLQSLTALSLSGTPVSESMLVTIGEMSDLTSLDLSDDIWYGMASRRRLRSLRGKGTQIDSWALRHLKDLRSLQHLDVRMTNVDDSALGHLSGLHSLESILADETRIRGDGLELLAALPRLSCLSLDGTTLSGDAGLALATLRNLEQLYLVRTTLTDEGVANFCRLRRLQELDLYATHVSDMSFGVLSELPVLTSVNVNDTRMSEGCIERLYNIVQRRAERIVPECNPDLIWPYVAPP